MRTIGLAVAVWTLGCGGAQFVLRDPVQSRCEDAKLKACADLTDGVLMYADGDKANGYIKVKEAVAQNMDDPQTVKTYVAALNLLAKAPTVGAYVEKVRPVIDLMDASANEAIRRGPAAGTAKTTAAVKNSAGLPSVQAAPAETPRTGTVMVAGHKKAESCTLLPGIGGSSGSAQCVSGQEGPLLVTDLHASGGCANDLAVFTGDADKPRWWVYVPVSAGLSMTGARLYVGPDETLSFAARGVGPLNQELPCAVTWSATRLGTVP